MKKLLFCLFLTLLTGCVSVTPSNEPPLNQKISWAERQQELKHIQNWQLQGAMAVKTPQQASTIYVDWHQQNKYYQLHLFGPLGTFSTTVIGKPDQITLYTSDKKTVVANSPEILLQQELGFFLPVSNLRYWILGLPAPTKISKIQFDAYHHILELDQQGWKIQYLNYTGIKFVDLPSKMVLNSSDLTLRIIINQWSILT